MVKKVIVYPTPPSVEYATDVRIFDDSLYSLVQDLKDTIEANNLKGLAGYQIGSYFNVIVVKQDDNTFLELVNPRLLSPSGTITTEETTAYFPNLSANVQRYKDISVIYQDKNAKHCTIKASGDLSILLQRKIDYTFGSTFLNKLSKDEKKRFEKKLEYGSNIAIPESCPIVSYKDYILKFANMLLISIVVILVASFFISESETLQTLWEYQKYISYTTVLIGIIYFFYGIYEGKQYSSCTSCQIGNLIGTLVILFIKLTIFMTLSYFLVT
jgi:peptide deformylase